MESKNRTEFTRVRLTKDELKYLQSEAKRLGITLSSLIRNQVCTNPQPIQAK